MSERGARSDDTDSVVHGDEEALIDATDNDGSTNQSEHDGDDEVEGSADGSNEKEEESGSDDDGDSGEDDDDDDADEDDDEDEEEEEDDDEVPELIMCAYQGDAERLAELLEGDDVEINETTGSGFTALHHAVTENNMDCVKLLIEKGADLNMYYPMNFSNGYIEVGENALHVAVTQNQIEMAELLLDSGADATLRPYHGSTLLGLAVRAGNFELADILRGRGMDLNEPGNDKMTILHDVVGYGSVPAVEYLLRNGVDPNARSENNATPLQVSISMEVSAVLLKHGADINAVDLDGDTCLHYAAFNSEHEGIAEYAEFLIKSGADTSIKDKEGRTPLDVSIAAENGEMIRLFLELGTDMTPTAIMLVAAELGYEDLVSFNVGSCDLNASNENGRTALHLAARNGFELIVEMLLLHGADVDLQDQWGRTPLHEAARRGGGAVTHKLIDYKANVKAVDEDGNTPLHLAAEQVESSSMRVLLDRGAVADAVNWDGHSPLMLLINEAAECITNDHVQLARLLCAQRAMNDAEHYESGSTEWTDWQLGLVEAIEHWEDCLLRADPLTEIPVEVVESGKDAVVAYVADVHNSLESQVVYRRKICVVGPSTWGKTSLVKSVASNTPRLVSIEDRTVGIDLFPFAFTTEDQDEEGNTHSKRHDVTFWDFAGQDIYHVAHSLFFSERTLFLVVVDLYAFAKAARDIERKYDPVSLAADNSMRRYLEEHVIHWIRKILLRQPEAEFVVVGTKKDLLKDDARRNAALTNLQLRLTGLANDLAKEVHLPDETKQRLCQSLSVVYPAGVVHKEDVEATRAIIERAVTQYPELSFPMPLMYMKVLDALKGMKLRASMATTPDERVDLAIQPIALLCNSLVRKIPGLEPSTCHEILHVLDRLGDVLWYQNERGVFMDEIILDPTIMLDIVREVVNHNYENLDGDDYLALQRDGTLRHSLLMTLPLWKALAGVDSEMVHMFKYLLQQFGLAYPAGNTEMYPEVDLIVPAYWTSARSVAASKSAPPMERPHHVAAVAKQTEPPGKRLTRTACWEYKIPAFVAKVVFENFVVQSYSPNVRRLTTVNGFKVSREGEFDATVAYTVGVAKADAVRITVAAADEALAWHELRFFVMAMEEMISRNYPALKGIQRHIIDAGTGRSHSVSDAVKALNDAASIGRDDSFVRRRMPWVPPSFSWYIEEAWLDPGKLHEIKTREAFGQIHHKISVLQKLVAGGDKRRLLPALWVVAYAKDRSSVQLRFLSDVSGMCYHLPIEIAASKLGSIDCGWLKVGVSVFANVAAHFISVDIVNNAITMATEAVDGDVDQLEQVQNCIDGLSLEPGTFDVSTEMATSASASLARLRELLALVDANFDELKVCELANLRCAATASNGTYVWAHKNEIEAMGDELIPCDPEPVGSSSVASTASSSPSSTNGCSSSTASVQVVVSSVTGLRVKDWFNTFCELQLINVETGRVEATFRTGENIDAHVEPVWEGDAGVMQLKSVHTLEALDLYKLVVRVKRPSRMEQLTWFRCERKLIAEGAVSFSGLKIVERDGQMTIPFTIATVGDSQPLAACVIHGHVRVVPVAGAA